MPTPTANRIEITSSDPSTGVTAFISSPMPVRRLLSAADTSSTTNPWYRIASSQKTSVAMKFRRTGRMIATRNCTANSATATGSNVPASRW